MRRLLFAFLLYSCLLTPSVCLAQESEEKAPAATEEAPAQVPQEKASITPAQAPVPAPKGKEQIKQISLEELTDMISYTYRGKVILLNFWGPYCGECLELLPMFSELYKKFRNQGFVAIGISLVGYPEKVWHSVNRVRVDFPVFMGNADVFSAYQIHNLPAVVLIGKDGKEELTANGHEANRKAFDKEITRLLEGRPKGIDWFQWLLR